MDRRTFILASASLATIPLTGHAAAAVRYYDARPGAGSRDVGFAPDGSVWYCGQRDGTLTRLDPATGALKAISLGRGAAPHGVVWGPDGAFWVTEGGQNAIARVDIVTDHVDLMPLPARFARANLNTGVFDREGVYWFTGQAGIHGRVNLGSGRMDVWESPGGRGSYGITVTPQGDVWYASLAGSHIARIDRDTGRAHVVHPPTEGQGARRVWSESTGILWVSEWNSGHVSRFDPDTGEWATWRLPGDAPRTYSVCVDEFDKIWLTDFGANAIVRFDPETEGFMAFPSDRAGANVRQMAPRRGEVWGGESGTNRLVRIATDAVA